jgi:circadian clock protein KaiC
MQEDRVSLGIPGLDDVLSGGLPAARLYLVQGTPGVGKTTLALQFLLEGVKARETSLYITLSETRAEIQQVAASHGWSLEGISLYELSSLDETLRLEAPNSLYATSDIELEETMRVLLAEVDRVKPKRVVFDSLSEIRLLAQTPIRFRRQLLSLKQYFAGRGCTVLLLDDSTGAPGDIKSLAHGVISLEQTVSAYGADRRKLRITKLRGSNYRSGNHDFVIATGGLQVFPRLVAAEHRSGFGVETMSTGVKELDELLGGGLDRGASTLFLGPAGTGKSAIAMQAACAAAARGERVALFLFEERMGTFDARAAGLGLEVRRYIEREMIRVQQIDPSEIPPDQFTHLVRQSVDEGARMLVVDSVSGYFMAMPDSQALALQLHELLAYTGDQGVASVLTLAQTGFLGNMRSPIDMSYLADTVVLFRYFEAKGRIHKAISVVKKRSGAHEDSIRKLTFGKTGICVGPPLLEFHGVLTGVPAISGQGHGVMATGGRGAD